MTTFLVYGRPATKGSTVSFLAKHGVVTTTDSVRLKPWTRAVQWAARAERVRLVPPPIGVAVHVEFAFARPKRSHLSAPTVRPDVDKLLRATLDALTGIGYVDDSQVISVSAMKLYAPETFTRITITEAQP